MRSILIVTTLVFCFGFAPSPTIAQTSDISDPWKSEKHREFDFWIGEWDVNLRIKQPDNTWKDSVKAKTKIYPILDGKAILELWDSPSIKGFSVRYFDPEQQKWILYLNWPSNSRSSIGSLTGSFRHGRGEFFTRQGNGSISRYTFSDISDNSLRWDDAFSKDGGKTWTNNWIMEFTRSAEKPSWPSENFNAHTFKTGNRCQGEAFDAINSMAGKWTGQLDVATGDSAIKVDATMNVYRILDGCSVLRFLEFDLGDTTYRNFALFTYNSRISRFEELRMDNRPGSTMDIMRGKLEGNQLTVSVGKQMGGKRTSLRHVWTLPTENPNQIKIESASSTDGGKTWNVAVTGTLKKE